MDITPTHINDRQAAARYSFSRATWWRLVRAGKAPQPVKLSPGCTRWRVADLEAWEKARAEATGGEVQG
ncbi:helix-turn-helix transcriptional regulator [Guyparkeria sp.]|uniref:helix-turn-helix transcriptional regulator n=1 Tax=Guyparkeria sp. TaxID=2035736 RepID=UPI003970559E